MTTTSVALAPGTDGSVVVTVARTVAEVEALRSTWTSAGPRNLDADPDNLLAEVAATPGARPHVVCLEAAGRPPVLIVARRAPASYRWKAGYSTLAHLSAPTIVVSFDGLVGDPDQADCARLVQVLGQHVRAGEAAAVLFQKVAVDSPLRRALDGWGSRTLRAVGTDTRRLSLELPESWEAWLALRSRKSRHKLRYDDNLIHRTFGDRMALRRYHPGNPDEQILRDMRVVAARAYQRGLGVNDLDGPTSSALLALAREHDWLRAWVLYVDDEPVAFWWGTLYAGMLSTGSPGYLPQYAEDRVGHYTLLRMIEDACADPDIRLINFGHGDAGYKERFSNASLTTADVTLFAPRPASVALRTLLALNAATASVADRIRDTEIGQRTKRRLRGRAVRRAAADAVPEVAEP